MAKRTKSAKKPKLGKRLKSEAGDDIMRITLHLPYELVRRSTLWGKEQTPAMDFDEIVIGALDAYVPMPSGVVVVQTPGQGAGGVYEGPAAHASAHDRERARTRYGARGVSKEEDVTASLTLRAALSCIRRSGSAFSRRQTSAPDSAARLCRSSRRRRQRQAAVQPSANA